LQTGNLTDRWHWDMNPRIVSAIGEGVEGFEIGDKVALEPGVPCGECEDCRKGHYNLCKHIKFMAIPHEKDGVFAEYCVHSASMCYKCLRMLTQWKVALWNRFLLRFMLLNCQTLK